MDTAIFYLHGGMNIKYPGTKVIKSLGMDIWELYYSLNILMAHKFMALEGGLLGRDWVKRVEHIIGMESL